MQYSQIEWRLWSFGWEVVLFWRFFPVIVIVDSLEYLDNISRIPFIGDAYLFANLKNVEENKTHDVQL